MKVGDRVRNIIVKDANDVVFRADEPGVIVDVSSQNTRYKIKYIDTYTIGGDNVVSWVDRGDITLDIEYYRDKKLKELGL